MAKKSTKRTKRKPEVDPQLYDAQMKARVLRRALAFQRQVKRLAGEYRRATIQAHDAELDVMQFLARERGLELHQPEIQAPAPEREPAGVS